MNAWRILELHIEELVLDGFGFLDRAHVAEAVHEGILALLAERGLGWQPGEPWEIARLDCGTVHMREGFSAAALGRRVAGALLDSMPPAQHPVGHGGNDARSELPTSGLRERVGAPEGLGSR